MIVCLSCGNDAKNPDTLSGPTVRVGLLSEPSTLDPAMVKDVVGGRITACIFSNLVRTTSSGKIAPDLAESWSVSKDGKIYTFILKQGVTFHNGDAITSSTVLNSFKRVLKLSPRSWVLTDIEGAEEYRAGQSPSLSGFRILDDLRFEVHLVKPFAPFLYKLAMPNAAIVPDNIPQEFARNPIGSGPFRFVSWDSGREISLAKNEQYHAAGLPLAKHLSFRFYTQDFSLRADYQNNQVDIIELTRSLISTFKSDQQTNIYRVAGLNVYFLGFNCKRMPFDEAGVRRAFGLAIDRDSIVETLFRDRAIRADGPIPPGLTGYRSLKPHPEYDPKRARLILSNNGFDIRKEYVLMQTENREILEVSQAIQQYLADIGVKIRIEQRETSSFKENLFNGNYDMFIYSWWADYPDAENFLYPLFHSDNIPTGGNPTFFSDPEIDRLIETSQAETDPDTRAELYVRIEDAVLLKMPRVFLWHQSVTWAARKTVKGFELYPIFNSQKFETVTR